MKKREEYTQNCGGIEMPKPLPNRDVELVFVLDKSGSMAGFEEDTVGGFNAMIEKQKGEGEGMIYVTAVLFSTATELFYDRVPIDEISPMKRADYCVGGCTALYDAVGETVEHISRIHKYARREDKPARTVFVITTDGMENASRHYTHSKVRRLIEQKTKQDGWEFIFLGANMDAEEVAEDIGIRRSRAATYRQTGEGIGRCFCSVSRMVRDIVTDSIDADDASWKEGLND